MSLLSHVLVHLCLCVSTHTPSSPLLLNSSAMQGSLEFRRCKDGVGKLWEILPRKRESSLCGVPMDQWAVLSLYERLSVAREWIADRVAGGSVGKHVV